MKENINLDELYPGMESLYYQLYNEYGSKGECDKNNLKNKCKIIILIAVIIMFFSLITKMFFIFDFAVLFAVFALGKTIFSTKSNINSMEVEKIENIILNHINKTIEREKNCSEWHNMKKEYDESVLFDNNYNSYNYNDYYKYYLKDDILVENVNLLVKEINPGDKADRVFFSGQFIKIKNKYNFKSRIDILKDKKIDKFYAIMEKKSILKEADFLLDNISFENSYKVFCEDKNYAYQFLTSDIMELLLEYREKMGVGFEITLVDDNIYIKIDEQFINLYSNAFNNPLKRSTVEYFIKIIKYSMEFIEKFLNKIDEKENIV